MGIKKLHVAMHFDIFNYVATSGVLCSMLVSNKTRRSAIAEKASCITVED